MKLFLRFADLFLCTSLFTACCATGLCMATERFINNTLPALISPLHLAVFGGTLRVYNAPRLFFRKITTTQPYRSWFQLFFIAGTLLVIGSVFWLPSGIIWFCLALAILTFSYSLPVLPFKNKKRLREYGWLKILVLAGVWTIATALLPMMYWNKFFTNYPFELLNRFVFIFALCIVFDIRDIRADMHNNINTLPLRLGLKNSYLTISIALLFFAALNMAQYLRHPAPERLIAAWITAVITWLVVVYLRKKPSEIGYMGLADGMMLLYASIILIY